MDSSLDMIAEKSVETGEINVGQQALNASTDFP